MGAKIIPYPAIVATDSGRLRPPVFGRARRDGPDGASDLDTILIVLHDLPLGGTERIAIRLANSWVAAGRRVVLLCGVLKGPLCPLIGDGVEVVECDPPIPRGKGSRRRLGEACARYIAQHRPGLLFIPGNFHWRVLPPVMRLPRAIRPRVVAQLSTPLTRYDRGPIAQAIYNIKMRYWLDGVDRNVSLSDAMSAEADFILGRRDTVCLKLPALDTAAAPPSPAPADRRLIVAAGRLVPEKGFDVAIRAFAHLDDPRAHLVILGEGPCRDQLLALARRLGVADRVDLPGYVPDIRPWLDRARVFLLSSFYEGYGAVVIEALAAGRQVVATDCTPAVAELMDPAAREAVAPIGDHIALAAALGAALAKPPSCPHALAASVRGFQIGPVAQAYLDLFDEVTGREILAPELRQLSA